METKNAMTDFFGPVISSYSEEEALEDGVLMGNYRSEVFPECNILTVNLHDKLKEICDFRNKSRVFSLETHELLGCLMLAAKDIYDNKKFEGDNDKDFFVTPKTEEGMVVWFVRNEHNNLTAMLPEDY